MNLEGMLYVSDRAHITLPYHRLLDAAREAANPARKIGTTQRGIGPTYVDKMMRIGVRVCDLFEEDVLAEKISANWEDKTHGLRHLTEEQRPHPRSVLQQYLQFAERLRPYVSIAACCCKRAAPRSRTSSSKALRAPDWTSTSALIPTSPAPTPSRAAPAPEPASARPPFTMWPVSPRHTPRVSAKAPSPP
jgi:hypothetical protein